ncbi:hypothetical protein WMF38_32145 [Sorangium sp. So ce118]
MKDELFVEIRTGISCCSTKGNLHPEGQESGSLNDALGEVLGFFTDAAGLEAVRLEDTGAQSSGRRRGEGAPEASCRCCG